MRWKVEWNKEQVFRAPVKFDTIDTFLVFAFTVVSFWTHFWIIQFPEHVVFDEVHFGNFTNWYTKSRFFFDIHPPLGKLIMFMFANLSEYDGEIEFNNDADGKAYENGTYIPLRITPAFFGAMCSPMVYLTVRFASFSKCAAFAAASLVCFDTSLLSEHRFILSDGMLHFFTCLHLLILFYGLSLKRGTFEFWFWQVLTGLSLGAACSCKNTAWGLCALNGLVHFIELWFQYWSLSPHFIAELMSRGVVLAGCALTVYFVSFIIHFALLPFHGQGSGYLAEDMRQQLIDTSLVGHELWGARVTGKSLIVRSIVLSVVMHTGNMHITQYHPSQSRPINWPLLTGIRVGFYSLGGKQEVSCLGNVFSYYFAFLGVIVLLFGYKNERWMMALRFTIGWAVSYFPFFLIPRSMYLYHYLIPLMLGCMSFGASLDLFVPPFFRGFMAVSVCFLAIVGFVLWESFCYGTTPWDRRVTIWNDNWLYGDKVHRELGGRSRNGLGTDGVHVVVN